MLNRTDGAARVGQAGSLEAVTVKPGAITQVERELSWAPRFAGE